MSVREHPQSFMLSAGKYGCYALCIVDIAREVLDDMGDNPALINDYDAIAGGCDHGYIDFDEDNYDSINNFYVRDPAGFLEYLTGCKFTVRHEKPSYKVQGYEYEVEFWAIDEVQGKRGVGHFIRPGKNTLAFSNTVARGSRYSKRIFTPVVKN